MCGLLVLQMDSRESKMTGKQGRAESIAGDLFLGLFCFKFNPDGLEKAPGSVADAGLSACGSRGLERA